jgi:SAM-dependent methyltransferase
MDVPTTVSAALEDRPVSGRVCLEAGAGVGNTTAGLLAAGAERVYAVTNDRRDATAVRDRVLRPAAGAPAHGDVRRDVPAGNDSASEPERTNDAANEPERTAVLEADVRALPLATDSIELITAHGLFNLLPPASLAAVTTEFRRVAAPGCHLIVDDYAPLPVDAAVRDLFAVENAASELACGRAALTFYPASVLRGLFEGCGWTFDRELTLLDPVPWTARHLAAHADVASELASALPSALGDPLRDEAASLRDSIGAESAGTMYSIALRLPTEAKGTGT